MARLRRAALLAALCTAAACGVVREGPKAPPTPAPTPLPPLARAPEAVVIRAWAEPRQLPAGGQTQLIVQARKRNGDPFEGLEVRFTTTEGRLFSQSRVLTTDAAGRTRDRLTTQRSARVTVDVGGTRSEIQVTVAGGR